jgi:hypothetical protein
VWGKNDRGQLGVGSGIGIDMVESENVPLPVILEGGNKIKDFNPGQNTMMIIDDENYPYKTGLKLDYSPKKLKFFDDFPKDDIIQVACGRKHYVILNKNS